MRFYSKSTRLSSDSAEAFSDEIGIGSDREIFRLRIPVDPQLLLEHGIGRTVRIAALAFDSEVLQGSRGVMIDPEYGPMVELREDTAGLL